MKIIIDTKGNPKQKQCAIEWNNPEVTDIVYGGSKGSGKSYIGCSLIFSDAFVYPETHYFIARKQLTDLRKFTIPTIYEVFQHWGITPKYYNYNGQDNYFELYNKSKVYLLDAKHLPSDPLYQRFGSMQMTRGLIEEAGEFVKECKNNLQISIGRWKNDLYGLTPKLLQTCNPSKNYLYRDYYLQNKEGNLESHKRFIQAFPQDNKCLDKGYLLNLERTLKGSEKERLLEGNWEYDDDPNAMVEYNDILALFTNSHVQEGHKYLTCDVARFGSDLAVIYVWSGWVVIDMAVFEISKTTDIQNKINDFRRIYQIAAHDCIADEDGVGGGVIDNTGIEGFSNGSRPLKQIRISEGVREEYIPNYENLKTQCAYHLADVVSNNQMWIKCDVPEDRKERILQEMEVLKKNPTEPHQKLKIVNKEYMKKLLGSSPDYLDTKIMRSWFDLRPNKTVSTEDFFVITI